MVNLIEASGKYLLSVADRAVGFYGWREVYRHITRRGSREVVDDDPYCACLNESKPAESFFGIILPLYTRISSAEINLGIQDAHKGTGTETHQALLGLASLPALAADGAVLLYCIVADISPAEKTLLKLGYNAVAQMGLDAAGPVTRRTLDLTGTAVNWIKQIKPPTATTLAA